MPNTTPAYRNLLTLIGSLIYTDFETIDIDDFSEMLRQAGVEFERGAYAVSLPEKRETYGHELDFELVHQSGHRNKIHMDFRDEGKLIDFHLKTSI